MIKGRSAKAKGNSAERKVRDQLRRIYPPELRQKVQRVPMSGASWMKGDVIDLNDTSMAIEVKNQEKLALPEWWRQTKEQAQSWQTPVLIFTQNHRPFYWVMRIEDWEQYLSDANRSTDRPELGSNRALMEKLGKLGPWEYYLAKIGDDLVAIIQNEDYITLKKELYEETRH